CGGRGRSDLRRSDNVAQRIGSELFPATGTAEDIAVAGMLGAGPGLGGVGRPPPHRVGGCWWVRGGIVVGGAGRGRRPRLSSPLTHGRAVCSSKISFARVAAHHSLAVEVISDVADRLLHHPAPPGWVVIIKRENGAPELVV